MKRFALIILICLVSSARSQTVEQRIRYRQAYREIADMLDGVKPLEIKRAVYVAEWAYLDDIMEYNEYCRRIDRAAAFLNEFIAVNKLDQYKTGKNLALIEYFFRPYSGNGYKPFEYVFGHDFAFQFVTPLMKSHKGQCRSLPMYYRILADAIGAEASIVIVPWHTFIRYRDDDDIYPEEWVNVELTAHQILPTFWLKDNFEVSDKCIQHKVYMHCLTARETVAAQLADLALGYVDLNGKHYDEFTLKCAEKALQHYPQLVKAIIIKGKSLCALLEAEYGRPITNRILSMERRLTAAERQLDSLGWRPLSEETEKRLERELAESERPHSEKINLTRKY